MGTGLFFCGALLTSGVFYLRRVGLHFGLASVLLGLLFLFHGPAYLYYTRVWGPETEFYWTILQAAPTADPIGTLDVALGLTFLGVCAGILLADSLCGAGPEQFNQALARWSGSEVKIPAAMPARIRTIAWLGLATLVTFAVLDNQVSKVVAYALSDASEFEKIALRREQGGSSLYLFNLLIGNVLPFIGFSLLALYHSSARMPMLLVSFVGMLLLAKLATLSKAPPAIFLLQLLVLNALRSSLQLSRGMITLLAAAAAALFVVMSIVAIPGLGGIEEALDFLFYRAFMIVNEGLMEYFAAIPHLIPHTQGLQAGWVAALLETVQQEPTYWIVAELHRGAPGSTSTVMFMGDAWADFAWPGVVLASVGTGLLVRWLDIQLILRRGKTAATMAGLALGHYGVFVAFSTALQTALLTGGLLFVLPLVALVSGRPEPVIENTGDATNTQKAADVT